MGEPSYIPEGFIHLEGTIEEGCVIQNETTGDEFVWIPVEVPVAEDETELSTLNAEGKYPMAVKTEGTTNGLQNYRGVLYDFDINETGDAVTITAKSYSATSDYREPAIVSDYDGTSDDTVGITQDLLQKEYNEFVESVIMNLGFYIGRYESGNLSQENAVVKKGANDIKNMTWYQMYKAQKNIYGENSNIKTHMIWGSQYDQVLIWMKDVPNTSENVTNRKPFYILNSIDMGVFVNNSAQYWDETTGKFKNKNIYDLEGNVLEWTMEGYENGKRVYRGGRYNASGEMRPASYRGNKDEPTRTLEHTGSRMTLYINN